MAWHLLCYVPSTASGRTTERAEALYWDARHARVTGRGFSGELESSGSCAARVTSGVGKLDGDGPEWD